MYQLVVDSVIVIDNVPVVDSVIVIDHVPVAIVVRSLVL